MTARADAGSGSKRTSARRTLHQVAVGPPPISRFLVVLGLAILLVGLLWPNLSRMGLGRLPGDIVIERDNVTFNFPLVTCLLLSLLFSLVFWIANRCKRTRRA